MKRILSGVQPSGKPHIGNYLGAIRQHIEMQKDYECFLFIADLHALTTVRNPELMRQQTYELAVTYLALGLDPNKTAFFKQSDIPEHAELCWIFDCITKMPFLERAHAWKDAQAKGKKEATVGLFNYPILMSADILLYQPDIVPVGKDQKQHVEIARDIATNFNQTFGETFKLPEPLIKEGVAVVPGTDGQKMSKSYGNTIDLFGTDAELKKQVMSIVTDSTPLEKPKNPDTCHIFNLYKLFANKKEIEALSAKYKAGGFGYGDAKKTLLTKLTEYFTDARKKYNEILPKKDYVYSVLEDGAKRAKIVASATLETAKKKIGYQP
ncbi:tryptophan--tRNA ligase [Candidatus Peregrinibacteria bacterium]|nr:tryptophan--tRNA ligase [Candidatus Peregrinibacteria bacterium]